MTVLVTADCVILNTGDSVIALHYSFPSAAGVSADSPPAPSPALYSSHLLQRFTPGQLPTASPPGILLSPGPCATTLEHAVFAGSSPSHLLPVDVYLGDQLMAACLDSDKVSAVCLSSDVWTCINWCVGDCNSVLEAGDSGCGGLGEWSPAG